MLYLVYFAGPLLGAAIAVGVYRLLNTPEAGPDLEPIPDVDEAPMDEDEDIEDVVIVEEEIIEEEPVQSKRSTRRTS